MITKSLLKNAVPVSVEVAQIPHDGPELVMEFAVTARGVTTKHRHTIGSAEGNLELYDAAKLQAEIDQRADEFADMASRRELLKDLLPQLK